MVRAEKLLGTFAVSASVASFVLDQSGFKKGATSSVDIQSTACANKSMSSEQLAKRPITTDEAASAAHDILLFVIEKWRKAALPQSALAEALIDAGATEVVRTQGPAGAAAMLLKLANEFGRSASGESLFPSSSTVE